MIVVPVALLFIVRVSLLLVRLAVVVVVVSLLLVRLGRRWGQRRFQHPRRGFAGVGRRSFAAGMNAKGAAPSLVALWRRPVGTRRWGLHETLAALCAVYLREVGGSSY